MGQVGRARALTPSGLSGMMRALAWATDWTISMARVHLRILVFVGIFGAVLATTLAGRQLGSGQHGGQLLNCPQAIKWAISVWDGPDDVETGEAVATCGPQAVAAAYYFDPISQSWSRWFAERPEISNLTTLNGLQGIVTLGSATATASAFSGAQAMLFGTLYFPTVRLN